VCVLDENADLGPKGVYTACAALNMCSNLKELRMSRCRGGSHGAGALAKSLSARHWRGLKRLYFGGNLAGNQGTQVEILESPLAAKSTV